MIVPSTDRDEEWRDVPNWEGYYQVSSAGRVRSVDRVIECVVSNGSASKFGVIRRFGKLRKLYTDAEGYLRVKFCRDAIVVRPKVHRLVAAAFLPPPPSKSHQIAHWDGDRANARLDNLRWATPKENTNDKFRHGTVLQGNDVGTAKLSHSDVAKIRSSKDKLGEIAKKYGVSRSQISRIRRRERWQ